MIFLFSIFFLAKKYNNKTIWTKATSRKVRDEQEQKNFAVVIIGQNNKNVKSNEKCCELILCA